MVYISSRNPYKKHSLCHHKYLQIKLNYIITLLNSCNGEMGTCGENTK